MCGLLVCRDSKTCQRTQQCQCNCDWERQITKDLAIEIIDVWLSSEFQGERHARRIQMLDSL